METTDPELERLLDIYEDAAELFGYADRLSESQQAALAINADWTLREEQSCRAALLAHIATRYAQRPPVPALLPTPADVDAGRCHWTEHGWVWTDYRAARGILPWRPGDELPEERIRRLRDGADAVMPEWIVRHDELMTQSELVDDQPFEPTSDIADYPYGEDR